MRLDKSQRKQLREAIEDAFPTETKLKIMLSEEMDQTLNTIVNMGNLDEIVFDLIGWAEREEQLEKLIIGSFRSCPRNQKLQGFLEDNIVSLLSYSDSPIPSLYINDLINIIKAIDNFDLLTKVLTFILGSAIVENIKEYIEPMNNKKYPLIFKIFLLLYILIKEYSKGKRLPRILEFLSYLNQERYLSDEARKKLKFWIEIVERECDVNVSVSEKYQPKLAGNIQQPYLLIIVKNASLDGECIVRSFLVFEEIDVSNSLEKSHLIPLRNYRPNQKNASITNREEEFICKFGQEQLLSLIVHFISESEKKINQQNDLGYKVNDLIIEFFLPHEYLFETIDLWEIPYGLDALKEEGKVLIGTKYRTVVRSFDRLQSSKSEIFRNQLTRAWEKVKQLLHDIPHPQNIQSEFECLNVINSNILVLRDRLRGKIALKLTCRPPDSKNARCKLLSVILEEGVPLVIWTRQSDIPGIDLATEIDRFLKLEFFRDLGQLFKLIKEERLQASAQNNPKEYLGYHLAILYDEPFRLSSLVNFLKNQEENDLRIGA